MRGSEGRGPPQRGGLISTGSSGAGIWMRLSIDCGSGELRHPASMNSIARVVAGPRPVGTIPSSRAADDHLASQRPLETRGDYGQRDFRRDGATRFSNSSQWGEAEGERPPIRR